MRQSVIIIAIIIALLSQGCSKHSSPTAAKVDKNQNLSSAQTTTTESGLVGTWVLDKIEIANMAERMSTFGSQAEKDKLNKTLELYQSTLNGMTVTFNKDQSYQSAYPGSSDVGTWTLKNQKDISVTSKLSSTVLVYQLVSIDASSIKVRFDVGSGDALWMTFRRKQ